MSSSFVRQLKAWGVAVVACGALLGQAAMGQGVTGPPPRLPGEPGLPHDAQAIVSSLQSEAAAVMRKADEQLAAKREQAIARLQALQDQYTRAAKLDEAVAIRDQIRSLQMTATPSAYVT